MAASSIPGPSCMNLILSVTEDDLYDPKLCIICQEDSKTTVTSQKIGRSSMKRAAKIRNDVVLKRIKSVIGGDEVGVYHNTNKYYNYTHIVQN